MAVKINKVLQVLVVAEVATLQHDALSSNSMSSWGKSAAMKALTVVDTWSGSLVSGSACLHHLVNQDLRFCSD